MKLKIWATIISVFFSFMVNAQENNVIVKSDPKVDTLIQLHIQHNEKYPLVAGYRIQIFKESGNQALDEAHQIMEEFHEVFPELPTYLSFQEPYYRVRAGNFKSKLEALDYLEKIKKKKYRNVWVISDYVYYADSLGPQNTFNHEQTDNNGD